MKIKNIKQSLLYFFAIIISVFCLFFFITCSWIGYDVKSKCRSARMEYKGDCTESLINLLKDEKKDFRSRNSAIWALGQLGDGRALPVLKSFYTGIIPAREPLNKTISQYELKKAISLTSGGLNVTAWVWRSLGVQK